MARNSTSAAASATTNTLVETDGGNAISHFARRNEPLKQRYTDEERERLLKAVDGPPTKQHNWNMVQQNFQAAAPPGATYRSADSLMKYFHVWKRKAEYHQRARLVEGTSVREIELVVGGESRKEIIIKRPPKYYPDEERERLLKAVGSAPTKRRDWNMVQQKFQAAAPQGATHRSVKSLRNQFDYCKKNAENLQRASLVEGTSVRETELAFGGDPRKERTMKTVKSIMKEAQFADADSPVIIGKRTFQDSDLNTRSLNPSRKTHRATNNSLANASDLERKQTAQPRGAHLCPDSHATENLTAASGASLPNPVCSPEAHLPKARGCNLKRFPLKPMRTVPVIMLIGIPL